MWHFYGGFHICYICNKAAKCSSKLWMTVGNARQTITIDELLFLIPLVPINSIKPGPASDSKISSNACQISRQEKFARIVRIYSIILHWQVKCIMDNQKKITLISMHGRTMCQKIHTSYYPRPRQGLRIWKFKQHQPWWTSPSAIMFLAWFRSTSGSLPSMGLWIITLTDPGYSIPSLPEGMILPVPIIVMGTTGTLVFAAILNAPFCESTNVEWNQTGKRDWAGGKQKEQAFPSQENLRGDES